MRLDKLLAHCGYGTRKDVKALLKRKQVTVQGEVETSAKRKVDPMDVLVNGEKVELPPTEVHLMLHKPEGYSCSHNPSESPLIYDLIPEVWQQAEPKSAGRLDRYTSGLLILSTDGQLLHRLVHPNKKVGKRYRVVFEGTLVKDAVAQVEKGLSLPDDDRPCLPATLTLHEPDDSGRGRATLLIHEGRFHQVRRMFEALGTKVVKLHRDRIGTLQLPEDLPEGHCRELTDDEIHAMTEDE